MGKYYDNFNTKLSNNQSIIHIINTFLGKNILGLEVGVYKALSFCTFLQCCPNIKHLYGIDSYKPSVLETAENYIMDEKEASFVKSLALHNIEYSGYKEKSSLILKDSDIAVNDFSDNSLDFIFLDSAVTEEHYKKELNLWYPKLKKDGLFSGHDWNNLAEFIIPNFYKKQKTTTPISVFDNVWLWMK